MPMVVALDHTEEWMSTSALEACLPASESVSHAACSAGSQQNSELYYRMVDPLAPMSLTGALWYQVWTLRLQLNHAR